MGTGWFITFALAPGHVVIVVVVVGASGRVSVRAVAEVDACWASSVANVVALTAAVAPTPADRG